MASTFEWFIPRLSGVYCISNIADGKLYVGSAANSVFGRWHQGHLWPLRNNKHNNRHLQAAWNKYGEHSFQFCVLTLCTPEECLVNEQFWIDYFQAANQECGYNLCPTAGSSLGIKHSPEYCAKMSASKKGVKPSPEVAARRKEAMNRPEVKEKIRQGHLGRKLTPEQLAKRRQIFSDPVLRQKLSNSHKGEKWSEERKANHKAAMSRLEVKKKMSRAATGRKHTEETKAIIGQAARNRGPEVNEKIRWAAANRSLKSLAKLSASVKASWTKRKQKQEQE